MSKQQEPLNLVENKCTIVYWPSDLCGALVSRREQVLIGTGGS